jgi:hypothetical protein
MVSCSKGGHLFNFSNLYATDNMGNMLGGDWSDGQWQNKTFTESEMALFKDLDTANISGTLKPSTINVRYALPNPFTNLIGIPVSLNVDFNGQFVVKYVVVNRSMKAVQKGVKRLQATSSSYFAINPAFSSGRYRLYFQC